jgi:cell division septation protein DedD
MATKTQPTTPSKTPSDSSVNKQPAQPIISETNTLVNVNIKKRIQLAQEKQDNTKQSIYPQDLNNYTVQVASFKSGSLARKETEKLKKMGFKALTFPSGKFILVCVGSFSNKKNAEPTKSELKKRYGDCIIRRL